MHIHTLKILIYNRALVISIGDSQNYYLSTARNDLGVIYAKCEESNQIMIPISWEEMICPVTKVCFLLSQNKVIIKY